MILQVWDEDGKLVINQNVRNEDEGLGIGLEYFQRCMVGESAQIKTRLRPRHEKDTRCTWDIGLLWPNESLCDVRYDSGRIVVLD